ncbi:serine/threonine-protein kinase [Pseudarthrobacter sp. ATCC 49987]|uniref:serine/threonine-protein kinase n=1 Tax=Pseudarthrobacter sp. ATCC 49987 TaxID=2698204 RepID=UPI001368DFF6|nr:serine/threonine-protein kinase [Pseudarthrobacter sp. ATCC 49987]
MEDFSPSGASAPEVPGYDVGRCLGRGGSAKVWLVTAQSTGREYALKCFSAGDGPGRDDAEDAARRETRILSVLDHEHLVRAHDVVRLGGGAAGNLGLTMDYAAGGSLGQLVASRGTLGPGETVTVLTPIAQALAYLHGQGFTHGDVSPGNVLFTAHGKPLLADLGVARMVADARAVSGAGTEGFSDPAPVDAVRAGLQPERDVYSLAAVGWFCLTGHPPEPGAQRPPLPLLVPGVPPALSAALESGLQEDRRLRPTAAELAAAVHRSAGAAPVDLSVSVHPTVIPQLLTRRSLPGTARERRAEQLRSLPHRFRGPRVAAPFPAAVHPGAGRRAGSLSARHSARHSGRQSPAGTRSFRPSAARPAPPGRAFRAVAVGVALLGILVAVWGSAGAGLIPGFSARDPGAVTESAPASAAPASAAPASAAPAPGGAGLPPGLEAQLASPDPGEAVRGLARLRSLAFSSGDFGLLEQVNVPASTAAAADGRISAGLKESGRVLAGFTILLTRVAAEGDAGHGQAVVVVTASTPAYQERDATGAVLAEAAEGPEQRLRLVLAPVEGRWRIQDILPDGDIGDTGDPAAHVPADTRAPGSSGG